MTMTADSVPVHDTYMVALIWDAYTSEVESQIVRDIIALQNESRVRNITVVTEHDNADKMLHALGVTRVPLESLAKLWILYKTKDEPMEAPENADPELVIERDFVQLKIDPYNLDGTPRNGYYLKQGGRPIPNQLTQRRPPSGKPPLDPWLALLYS